MKQPELFCYCYFDKIWNLRNRHMKPHLPSKNIFYLLCCLEKDCLHPFCQLQNSAIPNWFNTGPSLSYFPLPIPDPERTFGNQNCTQCSDCCSGHFLNMKPGPEYVDSLTPMVQPPSEMIKAAFD